MVRIDAIPTEAELRQFELVMNVGGRTLFEGNTLGNTRTTILGSFRATEDGQRVGAAVEHIDDLPIPSHHYGVLGGPATVAEGELILVNYLDLLEAGHAEAAAACFSEDAVYSSPPVPAGNGRRGLAVGRSAIHQWFVVRGVNEARHHVEAVATDGAGRFLVDGWVSGITAGDGSFFSSFWVDSDGLICRYVAILRIPRVE